MIAWRTFACTVAALGLLSLSNCGDDGELTTGLSAGSAGGGSSSEASSSSSGSSEGTSDATNATTDPGTTANPTTGPATTGPSTTGPATTGDASTGDSGGTTSGGGMAGCGNGKIDPNEQCDGANLNGFTCESLGNAGGTLACDPVTCTFDTSLCDGGGGGTSG